MKTTLFLIASILLIVGCGGGGGGAGDLDDPNSPEVPAPNPGGPSNPVPPPPPKPSPTKGVIKAAWEPPKIDPNMIAGYRIYWARAPGQYNRDNSINVGKALSVTVQDLEKSQTYYFIVRGYGQDLIEGTPSNEAVGMPKDP